VEFGLVGAELLAGVGDSGGATMAITKQASRERYAPLAALLWVRMAELTDSAFERSGYLDQALSFSPACYAARFARFQFRASVGDLNGALADAEHLEAAASGNQARHEAILNTARHLQELGFVEPAGRLFERALRYLPKDARANLGLGEALLSAGKPERAFGLIERAIDAAGADAEVAGRARLLLAKLLSEHYRDLPQAIARARAVTGTSFVAVEARALEAKLREQLGDLAGAELSYARMRDTLELVQDVDVRRATLWLRDAARLVFTKGERRAAERHLAIALRLSPRDPDVLAAYREVNLLQSGVSTAENALEHAKAAAPVAAAVVVAPAAMREPVAVPVQAPTAEVDDVELERRVEQLKGELAAQTTPSVQLLEALSQGLGRLGRNSELYALLQARFEDAPPAVQDTLRPQLRQVLDQLIVELADSSPEEASVYRMMRAQLGD
jgi:tetratricopeptide (TPR) repeat protein